MKTQTKIFGLALWTATLLFMSMGCDTYIVDRNPYYYDDGGGYYPTVPPRPTNVRSVTGDGRVYLYWTPVSFGGFGGYAVYCGTSPTGYYDYIGTTYSASFTDVGLTNGITYYYAIATCDIYGNESELSRDIVHDTPRPEGHSYYLWASEYYYYDGGFDLSRAVVVPWDHPTCDVFFGRDALGYYLCAANDYTDIMNYGPAVNLEAVDIAPDYGWSTTADVSAIVGNIYVIWTADNHFAALHIRDISGERLVFDWAYQTAEGNPELRPSPEIIRRRENRTIERGLRLASEGE